MLIKIDLIQNRNVSIPNLMVYLQLEIESKIKEIDEDNEILENKIKDITVRAEKCDFCKRFLGEEGSFLNASMTNSVNLEVTNHKINNIGNVSVKKLIHDKPVGNQILTSQDDIVESEFKNVNESPSDFFLEVSLL